MTIVTRTVISPKRRRSGNTCIMGMCFFSDGMFSDGLATAIAQGTVRRVVPNRGSIVPTPLAFYAFGFRYRNLEVRGLQQISGFLQFNLRYDKKAGQVSLIVLEEFISFGIGLDDHFGFERGANQLFSTLDFQRGLDMGADDQQLLPAPLKVRI